MFAIRDFFIKILPDLKDKEGEFQEFYLQDTVIMYSIIGIFVCLANIAMMYLDTIFLRDHGEQLFTALTLRIIFSVFTLGMVVFVRLKPTPNRVHSFLFTWLFVTVLYFLVFSFLRPTSHLTTNVDVLLIFGVYVFSSIRLRHLLLIMTFFSLASIALIFLVKTEVPLGIRILVTTVHIIVQGVGLISAVQIRSFRIKAFLAYVKEREINQLATQLLQTDSLTGSFSRRYFLELAERELTRTRRYKHPFSVLMMDIDQFKKINDQYGHRVGDHVLMAFSKTIIDQKRESDLFGRLGGEEFALLLPETALEQAQFVAERIKDEWARTDLLISGLVINSSVSIGVAELEETDQMFEDLLHRADMLMYTVKHKKTPPLQ